MVRGALAASLAAVVMAWPGGVATASEDPADVLGSWAFQTTPYRNGGAQCEMSGTMYLSEAPGEGLYQCELTAIEDCTLWGRTVVRQSCQARRFGNQVSVRSSVEEMLDVEIDPDEFALTYLPDNFALTVQSPSRMYGSLVSAVTAPVEFRRNEEGIS